ncbi:MAG: 4Fe-4S binding protein, partial [Lachnospiraceae bacterium]|nr:4Fe-4S binding protein [Lachnospiraceae bacterium]
MRKKRGFFTQFIRHLIQIAAFILFPGLFIMVFSAVRDILTAFMNGSFSAGELFPQIILVFMIFLITALWGRFFCGFLCSFGMLQELIFFLSKRVISGKVRIPERFDFVMKFLKYVILAFIVAGVWILALPVDSSWNPWGVFGMLVSGNLSVISTAIPT